MAKKKCVIKKTEECHFCGEEYPLEELDEIEIFVTPFEEEGKIVYACGECDEEGYFTCGQCGRLIADDNGMRVNYKLIDCEQICVDCYQKNTLKNGQPITDFKKGDTIVADFYNVTDLKENGFEKIESYSAGMLRFETKGMEDVMKAKKKAIELIKEGKKVIVNIDEASSVGGGGYFSIWAK